MGQGIILLNFSILIVKFSGYSAQLWFSLVVVLAAVAAAVFASNVVAISAAVNANQRIWKATM